MDCKPDFSDECADSTKELEKTRILKRIHKSNHATTDFPEGNCRTDCTGGLEDGSKSSIHQIRPACNLSCDAQPFFHAFDNFIDPIVSSFADEIVSRQFETETASAECITTATARIWQNIQFINTEQRSLQLSGLFVGILQPLGYLVTSVADIGVIHLREREIEEGCDDICDDSQNLSCRNRIRENQIQCRDENITQCSCRLFDLSLKNSQLVSGAGQRSCHVTLYLLDLRHDCVVAQFCFLSLGHTTNRLVDTETQCSSLQFRLREVVTESTQRLKFTCQTRLQFLHCVFDRSVIERGNIIAQLSQLLRHRCRSIGCHTKAGGHSHEHTLVAHPRRRVDTHDFTDCLGVLLCRLCIFAHRHFEEA